MRERPAHTGFLQVTVWPGWVGLMSSALAQIRPLEEAYKFGAFFSSLLNESDFHAKPSVLLLGQYSTGVPHLECHGLGA